MAEVGDKSDCLNCKGAIVCMKPHYGDLMWIHEGTNKTECTFWATPTEPAPSKPKPKGLATGGVIKKSGLP